MLKRREDSKTYLTHVCRHHWSKKSPVKIDEISGAFSESTLSVYIYSWWKPQCCLKAPDILSIFNKLFLLQRCLQTWVRWCRSFPFLAFFYHFTFSGFPFILIFTIAIISINFYSQLLWLHLSWPLYFV